MKYCIEQDGDLWKVARLCDNPGLIDTEEKCGDMLYRIIAEAKHAGFDWDKDNVLEELLALLPTPYCFDNEKIIEAFDFMND